MLATIEPRLERLLAGLRDRRCDAALLIGASHAAHMLAYQRVYSGPLALIVAADGEITVVAPVYEVDAVRAHAPAVTVVGFGEPGFGLDLASLDKLVSVAAAALSGRRVGIASDVSGLAQAVTGAAGVEHVAIDDLVHDVRLIKDAEELALIARSYELALVGQAAVEAGAVAGSSEIELFTAAHAAAQIAAGEAVAFGSDLLIGTRSAEVCGPVAVPGVHRAAPGDVVLADVAVGHRGYWGDTARTFIAGENAEVDAVRTSIGEVLAEAALGLRPGVRGCDVFARMEEEILRRHPGGTFPHHGGHGVGVTGFEDPHLIPADASELREGMAIAIEPGVYFAGRFGVREENVYVVTASGGIDLRTIDGSER